MKTESEIRAMLARAKKERDSYPGGDGEFVWQDGFMSALMTVLDEPSLAPFTEKSTADASAGRAVLLDMEAMKGTVAKMQRNLFALEQRVDTFLGAFKEVKGLKGGSVPVTD